MIDRHKRLFVPYGNFIKRLQFKFASCWNAWGLTELLGAKARSLNPCKTRHEPGQRPAERERRNIHLGLGLQLNYNQITFRLQHHRSLWLYPTLTTTWTTAISWVCFSPLPILRSIGNDVNWPWEYRSGDVACHDWYYIRQATFRQSLNSCNTITMYWHDDGQMRLKILHSQWNQLLRLVESQIRKSNKHPETEDVNDEDFNCLTSWLYQFDQSHSKTHNKSN